MAKVRRAHKIRLNPTPEQETYLLQACDDDLPMLEDLFCRLYQVEQPAESKNEEPEPF